MKNKVKRFRTRAGYTLQELSFVTGISVQDISMLENGKRPAYPSWRKRLSEALGVDEGTLFPEIQKEEKKHENSSR